MLSPRLDTLLSALKCPECGEASFSFVPAGNNESGGIPDGDFACGGCGKRYALKSGIADFLPSGPSSLTMAQRTGQWGVTASAYERVWRKRALTLLAGKPFPPEREHKLLLDALEPALGGVVVDLGCSTSFYGRPIARKLLENTDEKGIVVGVDLSTRMLEEARKYATEDGVTGAMLWIRADAERLPFRDDAINAIACGGTLNEYRRAEDVLREGRRVLTSETGRYFVMNQLDPPFIVRSALSFLGGLTFFTRAELDRTFEKAGLTALSKMDIGKIAFTTLKA
jgi:SAM-dependent methyltransferase